MDEGMRRRSERWWVKGRRDEDRGMKKRGDEERKTTSFLTFTDFFTVYTAGLYQIRKY